ncbi:MAG: hypothetical protein ACLVKO_01960 [Dysgonomonas sp.]
MQNRDNNFETLIGHAKSMLGRSYEGLKRKYLHYPISLTVHLENKILEKVIEIRFSEQQATTSLDFDQTDECTAVYLFFDTQNDENSFIEYLAKSYDFDFRKNCWIMANCYLKIKPSKYEIAFLFYEKCIER